MKLTRRGLFATAAVVPLSRALAVLDLEPGAAAARAPAAVREMTHVRTWVALLDPRKREVSGGGYARAPVDRWAADLGPGPTRATRRAGVLDLRNEGRIEFPPATASWGTVEYVAVYSRRRRLLACCRLASPRFVQGGDTVHIPGGMFKFELDVPGAEWVFRDGKVVDVDWNPVDPDTTLLDARKAQVDDLFRGYPPRTPIRGSVTARESRTMNHPRRVPARQQARSWRALRRFLSSVLGGDV